VRSSIARIWRSPRRRSTGLGGWRGLGRGRLALDDVQQAVEGVAHVPGLVLVVTARLRLQEALSEGVADPLAHPLVALDLAGDVAVDGEAGLVVTLIVGRGAELDGLLDGEVGSSHLVWRAAVEHGELVTGDGRSRLVALAALRHLAGEPAGEGLHVLARAVEGQQRLQVVARDPEVQVLPTGLRIDDADRHPDH